MTDLILRPTAIGGDRIENDYCVWFDGRCIGRIMFAADRTAQLPGWNWMINPPLPIPTWADGTEESLDAAKEAFRGAWERFYARLTPEAIRRWHQVQDACQR